MLRALLAALATFALAPAAYAQSPMFSPGTTSSSPPTTSLSPGGNASFSPSSQQVQLVAPQLVPFAGSTGNFESLVTGLSAGTTVTLATVGADGSLQIVTFTPVSAVLPGDVARLLETARQNLISRGVAAPTGTQIAASLMGGTITTVSGSSTLTGVLTGASSSPTPVLVRTDPGTLQNGVANSNISPAQLLAVRNGLATGTGVTLTSGGGGTTQNIVFSPTGVRLSDFEVNQALQLAATLLAQQGVLNPTADQLRVALFGGTLVGTNGTGVQLQGVLQGPIRNTSGTTLGVTSASSLGNTSNSGIAGTSNAGPAGTSNSSAAGTSNSPVAGSAGASSSGGTAGLAPMVPRGSAGPARFGAR